MTVELRFKRFDKARHDRSSFDCGVAALNDFLRKTLNQHMQRGLTTGYVLAEPGGRIAGYFTLSSSRLMVGVVPAPAGFPARMPLPATLIGRLGVDVSFKGQGLGSLLLLHAIRLAVEAAPVVASAVIEVDAKDEAATRFYARYGFVSLTDDDKHMYLPMADATALVKAPV